MSRVVGGMYRGEEEEEEEKEQECQTVYFAAFV